MASPSKLLEQLTANEIMVSEAKYFDLLSKLFIYLAVYKHEFRIPLSNFKPKLAELTTFFVQHNKTWDK